MRECETSSYNSYEGEGKLISSTVPMQNSDFCEGLQPPETEKAIIFRAKAKCFGQKPAAKNVKKLFCIFIECKNRNSFHPAR